MPKNPLEAARPRYPLPEEYLTKFVKKGVSPPLTNSELLAQLFLGSDEQQAIKMPKTGNANLLLKYKGHEGAMVSWDAQEEELRVLARQGARSQKSWRVSKTVDWIKLFAAESLALAGLPQLGIRRLTMPHVNNIENLTELSTNASEHGAMEAAINRYLNFVAHAMMPYSTSEQQYVRDIKK